MTDCLCGKRAINTLLRRIVHAILFEIFALIILVPLMSYGFNMNMLHFGALAIILALCAMACNMLYNQGYEMLEARFGWQRTLAMRVVHTIGFEICFMAIALPLTAWWLDMTIIEALFLDLVFSLFFMLYAFCFNWIFDIARHRWARRRAVTK